MCFYLVPDGQAMTRETLQLYCNGQIIHLFKEKKSHPEFQVSCYFVYVLPAYWDVAPGFEWKVPTALRKYLENIWSPSCPTPAITECHRKLITYSFLCIMKKNTLSHRNTEENMIVQIFLMLYSDFTVPMTNLITKNFCSIQWNTISFPTWSGTRVFRNISQAVTTVFISTPMYSGGKTSPYILSAILSAFAFNSPFKTSYVVILGRTCNFQIILNQLSKMLKHVT